MRVLAYYGLHYGREWMNWSMRSVKDFVDEIHVFYTPKPSHGHGTTMNNPESRGDLKAIADEHAAHWHEGIFSSEGQHRDYAVNYCIIEGKADLVLVVDADEIWPADLLQQALKFASESDKRNILVRMVHFWRSVSWGMPDDPLMPVRIINAKNEEGEDFIPVELGKVLHMGYAQSPQIVEYKQTIHGHASDWRENWFQEKFLHWAPGVGDVHPTNVDFWNPVKINIEEYRDLIGDHPYFNGSIIR